MLLPGVDVFLGKSSMDLLLTLNLFTFSPLSRLSNVSKKQESKCNP